MALETFFWPLYRGTDPLKLFFERCTAVQTPLTGSFTGCTAERERLNALDLSGLRGWAGAVKETFNIHERFAKRLTGQVLKKICHLLQVEILAK